MPDRQEEIVKLIRDLREEINQRFDRLERMIERHMAASATGTVKEWKGTDEHQDYGDT